MDISQNILGKLQSISDGTDGLGTELFRFVAKLTPYMCVDLIVKDPEKGVLMTWRDEEIYGKGWHIPGGVVRYKETMSDRIEKVAENELHAKVTSSEFIDLKEFILEDVSERKHAIVARYVVTIDRDPTQSHSEIRWFKEMPKDILKVHRTYSDLFS